MKTFAGLFIVLAVFLWVLMVGAYVAFEWWNRWGARRRAKKRPGG